MYTLRTDSENIFAVQKYFNLFFANEKIAYSIKRIIANQFFSDTGTENQLTIIGRFIPGVDGNWSVVGMNNLIC